MVCHTHGHAEVESHTKGLEGGGQAGHARNVLGDGEPGGIHFLHKARGQGQVDDGVLVHAAVKVKVIIAEILAQAVVPVQHGSNPVKAEAVYVVLLHPVFHVGQEKVAGFVLAVIEAAGAPGGMASLRAAVEVQVVAAVELGEALGHVVYAVTVHDIHDDGDSLSVGVVHQGLELLGRTETGTQCEEIAHLIAERAVIGVLLQGHDLDGVVAQFLDAGQDILTELFERAHLLLFCRHADMAFVNHGMGPFSGVTVLPDIFFRRVPDLGAEHLGNWVLHNAGSVGRDSLSPAAGPLDEELVELAVTEEHLRNAEFPVSAAEGL